MDYKQPLFNKLLFYEIFYLTKVLWNLNFEKKRKLLNNKHTFIFNEQIFRSKQNTEKITFKYQSKQNKKDP